MHLSMVVKYNPSGLYRATRMPIGNTMSARSKKVSHADRASEYVTRTPSRPVTLHYLIEMRNVHSVCRPTLFSQQFHVTVQFEIHSISIPVVVS